MNPLRSLAEQWRADAACLRRRMDERGALLVESMAKELEDALQAEQLEALTLDAAAEESGYSRSHLRREIREGKIPNAGTEIRPLILRAHLPRKPGHAVAPQVAEVTDSRLQVARAVAAERG